MFRHSDKKPHRPIGFVPIFRPLVKGLPAKVRETEIRNFIVWIPICIGMDDMIWQNIHWMNMNYRETLHPSAEGLRARMGWIQYFQVNNLRCDTFVRLKRTQYDTAVWYIRPVEYGTQYDIAMSDCHGAISSVPSAFTAFRVPVGHLILISMHCMIITIESDYREYSEDDWRWKNAAASIAVKKRNRRMR